MGPIGAAAEILPNAMASDHLDCGAEAHVVDGLPGDHEGGINDMNRHGWAVGWSDGDGRLPRAVLWRDGDVVDLGLNEGEDSAENPVYSDARSVNSDGTVAVNALTSSRE